MRLPWKKTSDEIVFEEKPKKPKETLAQVADKILIRKMKRDPDGYGLQAAERIKNIGKEESKSLAAQLKELRETQRLLHELGSAEGSGSWLKELGIGVAQALAPHIGQVIQNLQNQPQRTQLPSFSVPQIEQGTQASAQERTEKQTLPFAQLVGILDLEPHEAVAVLAEVNPQWVAFLSTQTYEGLVEILQQVPTTEETKPYIEQLLSKDRQKWLKAVIQEARTSENAQI